MASLRKSVPDSLDLFPLAATFKRHSSFDVSVKIKEVFFLQLDTSGWMIRVITKVLSLGKFQKCK